MWVAVLVSGGLCWVGLIVGAVGWQVWDSWEVDVVLLVLELGVAASGWQVRVPLAVSVVLFRVELMLVAVVWLV